MNNFLYFLKNAKTKVVRGYYIIIVSAFFVLLLLPSCKVLIPVLIPSGIAFYNGVRVCPSSHPVALLYCGSSKAFPVLCFTGKVVIIERLAVKAVLKVWPEEYRLDNLFKKYGFSDDTINYIKHIGRMLYKENPDLIESLSIPLGDDFLEALKQYLEIESREYKENKN